MNSNEEKQQKQPLRVVSLLGAATEIIYRLGLGNTLVGRSHECDYPPAVLSLPCISRPRLDVNAPSKQIDATVRQRSAAGEPIYKLDDDVLSKLASPPLDLLITQNHCRVCAVTPSDVNQSDALACQNVKQLVLKPSTLADCLENVLMVAVALGVPERGRVLCETLQEQMDRVTTLTSTIILASSMKKPSVALLEWCDPIMGCGYWLPELVNVANGIPLHCPPPGGATPNLSFQTLLNSKPDVVVFALCGFGLSRSANEIVSSWNPTQIKDLSDVCKGRIYVVDGNYLMNRSGPRVVESCQVLAEALFPELLGHFGHFGTDLLTTLDQAIYMAEKGQVTGSAKVRPLPFDEYKSTIQNNDITKTESESNSNDKTNDTYEKQADDPATVVANQLQHLKSSEYQHAFLLNSKANQDRWCGAERFAAVLRSHTDFRRLLNEKAITGEVQETKGGMATVRVSLPPREIGDGAGYVGGVELLWTMVVETELYEDESKQQMVWRTEKVGFAL